MYARVGNIKRESDMNEGLRKAAEKLIANPECTCDDPTGDCHYCDAWINLEKALAATEQSEPVAWECLLVEGARFKSPTHGWVTYKGVDVYYGQMTHKFKPDEYEMAYWLPDSLNVHLGDTSHQQGS